MSEKPQSPSTIYYQALAKHRGESIGFFDMPAAQWLATLGVAVGVVAVGWLVITLSTLEWAGWAICGVGLGSLLRDIGSRRRSIAVWPLLDAVVDWSRVEALLGEANS